MHVTTRPTIDLAKKFKLAPSKPLKKKWGGRKVSAFLYTSQKISVMVKVTEKYLFRKLAKKPQIQQKKKDESNYEYLNRITHLYLQSQFIDRIEPMRECPSITVIYLQDNQLQTIHNLDSFPNLSYLYLHKNNISRIENLNVLRNLKKLYLGSNEIFVLEGLDELENLTELHIERQRLPEGDTIHFDPRTIKSLSKTLKVLNISQNNITRLTSLSGLLALEDLIACDNKVDNVADVLDTLSKLTSLQKLKLTGNPITTTKKYRETVILASTSLRILDDKEISSETRSFVENLALNKERSLREPQQIPRPSSDTDKMAYTPSGSKLFPLLKMHKRRMSRTASTFSATAPPHLSHQSLRTFQYRSPPQGQNSKLTLEK